MSRDSQVGNNFISEAFRMADPDPVADLLARHDAALQRITVLERAIEKALIHVDHLPVNRWSVEAARVLEKALNG